MNALGLFLGGLLAALGYQWVFRFPHPYESEELSDVSAYLELFPAFPANLTGAFTPNTKLQAARRLFENRIEGAESVDVTPDGTLLMLDKFGYLYKARVPVDSIDPNDFQLLDEPERLYIGPGRPLGFQYLAPDSLVVCDSLKGLLQVNIDSGEITILSNAVSGSVPDPLSYVNDVDIADNSSIFFSSSTRHVVAQNPSESFYDTFRSFVLTMATGDATGRVLHYDPVSRRTNVVMDGLWFPNGVAVSHDQQSILVVETIGFRVLQHFIKGPKAGITEVLVDKLPGFPDGITTASDGNYWVSLPSPVSSLLSLFHFPAFIRYPWAHVALSPVLKFLIKKWACVVKVSPTGEVIDVLMDPTGNKLTSSTAVTEHDGRLFIGNLKGNYVSVYDLE